MVARTDVDVVDIEQDAAVRPPGHRAEKFPLAHSGFAERYVRGDVLEQDLSAQRLLHTLDALDDMGEGLFGERQRPEVVRVTAAVTAPAEVVGNDRGLDAIDQCAQRRKIGPVERVGGPDGKRNSVQRDRHLAPHFFEDRDGPAPRSEIVLADRLHPVDRWLPGEHRAEMAGAKPDAMPQVGSWEAHAETGRRHEVAGQGLLTSSSPKPPCRPWSRRPWRSSRW